MRYVMTEADRKLLFERTESLVTYCEDERNYISKKPDDFYHHFGFEGGNHVFALTWYQITVRGERLGVRATFTYDELLDKHCPMNEMYKRAMETVEMLMLEANKSIVRG